MKRLKRPISLFGSLNKWEIAQTEGGLQRQILRSIERLAAALPEDAPMTISREDFDYLARWWPKKKQGQARA